jgi:hypothetical protein
VHPSRRRRSSTSSGRVRQTSPGARSGPVTPRGRRCGQGRSGPTRDHTCRVRRRRGGRSVGSTHTRRPRSGRRSSVTGLGPKWGVRSRAPRHRLPPFERTSRSSQAGPRTSHGRYEAGTTQGRGSSFLALSSCCWSSRCSPLRRPRTAHADSRTRGVFRPRLPRWGVHGGRRDRNGSFTSAFARDSRLGSCPVHDLVRHRTARCRAAGGFPRRSRPERTVPSPPPEPRGAARGTRSALVR